MILHISHISPCQLTKFIKFGMQAHLLKRNRQSIFHRYWLCHCTKHFKKRHTLNWLNWALGFYDPLYTKMFKLLFDGFIFSIVNLQAFFLALYQNPKNGIFSMMNQIESYLTFRRLTGDISY